MLLTGVGDHAGRNALYSFVFDKVGDVNGTGRGHVVSSSRLARRRHSCVTGRRRVGPIVVEPRAACRAPVRYGDVLGAVNCLQRGMGEPGGRRRRRLEMVCSVEVGRATRIWIVLACDVTCGRRK